MTIMSRLVVRVTGHSYQQLGARLSGSCRTVAMSSIATIAVGFAPCAFALSCPAYRSAVDIADSVDLVLVGRVIRREHGFHEGDGPVMAWIKSKFDMTVRLDFMGVKWDVEPVEVLKGRSPKSLVVWSPDD
jgi:hypothetical protein